MDLSKIGTGDRIAAISAVVLILSMFLLGWFSIEGAKFEDTGSGQTLELSKDDVQQAADEAGEDTSGSAFQALSTIDILLVIAAVVVIGGVALRASGNPAGARIGPLMAAAAGLAFVLVLFRTVIPPDLVGSLGGSDAPDEIKIDVEVGRGIGVFVGLLVSAAMAYGAYLVMSEGETPASGTPGDRSQV